MDSLWRHVHGLCQTIFDTMDARRATNLLIAAAVAVRGTEMFTRHHVLDLARELGEGALSLAAFAPEDALEAASVTPRQLTAAGFDAWVEAFQASAHDRKTAGAFATPSVLADLLAEGALDGLSVRLPRIIDPSAGAGNLLLAGYRALQARGLEPAEAVQCLFGVELDPAARELCILQLWLSTDASVSLTDIAARIRLGNAVTRDWSGDGAFDVVLMNPPWESLRPQKGELWDDERLATIDRLIRPSNGAPGLPPLFTAQGRGDRNLFKAFVELVPHLLRPGGRMGLLIPAAFGSDLGMAELRRFYFDHLSLERWSTYENRRRLFSIDSRYKFGLLFGTRDSQGTRDLRIRAFCEDPGDLSKPHVTLSRDDLETLGGPDRMIPELVSHDEQRILRMMLRHGTPLFEDGPFGRPRYRREVDLTLDKATGAFWKTDDPPPAGASENVPLIEGRMVGQYDCFQKSYVGGEGRRAVWEDNADRPLAACRSQYVTSAQATNPARVALCDVTSSTNTRTVLAALVPETWRCGNTAPILQFAGKEPALAALAVLNSLIFDWMARRLLGGLHLNKFYLERFVWPRLSVDESATLCDLARQVLAASPRNTLETAPSDASARSNRIQALASINAIVARAYGLDHGDVAMMLSADRGDRRGFWRYYAAGDDVVKIAERTLHQMAKRPKGAGKIAA